MHYLLETPAGRLTLDFEVVAGSVGRLTLDAGGTTVKLMLVRSQE